MRIPQTEGMFLYEYGELYVEMTGRIYLLFAEASRKAPYPWNPLSCQALLQASWTSNFDTFHIFPMLLKL